MAIAYISVVSKHDTILLHFRINRMLCEDMNFNEQLFFLKDRKKKIVFLPVFYFSYKVYIFLTLKSCRFKIIFIWLLSAAGNGLSMSIKKKLKYKRFMWTTFVKLMVE